MMTQVQQRLSFQPADAADIDPIYKMAKELIDTYEQVDQIPYDKVIAWVKRKIEDHIGSYTTVYFDGMKAGYYRLCDQTEQAELDDLYILPEFRNRGIGTAVLQHCFALCSKPIFLYVFTGNAGAQKLYARLGFSVCERVSSTRMIMRWTVDTAN